MYDRTKTVGASDAVHIQSGQWAELFDRKQSPDPPEYGLAAEIGKRLEGFNLELFTRETGREVHIAFDTAPPVQMAEYPWCKYLPDALTWTETDAKDESKEPIIPVEAKCINMMWKPYNLLAKYMPQLQHAMRVMSAPYCYFSVLYLNTRFEVTEIPYDPPYDDALFEKEKLFQWFLETGTRPPEYLGKRKGWI